MLQEKEFHALFKDLKAVLDSKGSGEMTIRSFFEKHRLSPHIAKEMAPAVDHLLNTPLAEVKSGSCSACAVCSVCVLCEELNAGSGLASLSGITQFW